VFLTKDVRKHEIIERSLALAIRDTHIRKPDRWSPLTTHAFHPAGFRELWICTGTGSFYNHRNPANVHYEYIEANDDTKADWMEFRAVGYMPKNTELFINYNGEWDDATEVTFSQ
jgi:hypothetical protein